MSQDGEGASYNNHLNSVDKGGLGLTTWNLGPGGNNNQLHPIGEGALGLTTNCTLSVRVYLEPQTYTLISFWFISKKGC